ncbi:hypothetical protein K488DRAFT_49762, partial [Vararia minispora EC-137]
KASDDSEKPGRVFDVRLEGEDDEAVPIYDSCDELRRKVNKHLRATGKTNAAFMREIAQAGWPDGSTKIQSKQLNDFLTKKGATAGAASKVFYATYCYFEKLRLFEGKPKSAHRKKMEDEWPSGLPREDRRSYWVPNGRSVVQDKFGKVKLA